MVSDGTVFAVGGIEKLFDEARRNTKAKHEKWAKYYDRRRRDVHIKALKVKRNNVLVWRAGKRLTVSVHQVRLYHHMKSDEKEIRTSSSRYKSSNFEAVQRRSNESQYSWKNGSDKRREKKADHLSDHHPAFGQNQIEEPRSVDRRLWN
ncbi:uncharacterized protein TNCV_3594921 [Trichonephila clavipes]|nr:uncharacterized protein TNCV_3594921 [Trichonephila clavipes]